jgi:hypothetical protein
MQHACEGGAERDGAARDKDAGQTDGQRLANRHRTRQDEGATGQEQIGTALQRR